MEKWTGRTIGNYRVIEEIGRGNYTKVYKVADIKLNRYCAMKVLQTDAFPAEIYEKVRERFEKETFSMAQLQHGNIIKIFDYGEYAGQPYIITEYAEGGSLERWLGRPYSEKDAAQLIIPLVDALDYAHRKGIYHRDIKPSNILLRKDGSPVLTDFGIANMLDERDLSGKTLAETCMGLGTVEYVAPEQSMGKQIDQRADQYSLGVIFYELLTGHKPFTGDNQMEILVQQYSGSFRDPKKDNINLSDKTLKTLNKCLGKTPDERFNTMQDFSTALYDISKAKTSKKNHNIAGKIIAAVFVFFILAAAGIYFFKPDLISGLFPPTAAAPHTDKPDIPTEETPAVSFIFTETLTATDTAVPTATDTVIPTATDTALPTATDTAIPTATDTAIPTATLTPNPSSTFTPNPTATNTEEPVPTDTPSPTVSEKVSIWDIDLKLTETTSPTEAEKVSFWDLSLKPTKTPSSATDNPIPTATDTSMPTATDTPIPAATDTAAPTATDTPIPTATDTPMPAATDTATPTATDTATPTATDTATPTATDTATPTATDTATPTATDTATPTATDTATPTATDTATPTATDTATPTATDTATPTATDTATPTATATNTMTPTPTPVTFRIGYGGTYYTLDDAWRELPENSGVVRLYLDNIKQLDGFISVPDNKGITELILDTQNKHTITCSGTRMFANGIPLTIGKNLTLSGMTIFGGTYAVGSTDKTVSESNITIYGSVESVYGGGEIRGESSYQGSSTVENANVSIYGTVTRNVFGGGYAVGDGSISHVEESHLYLDKRAIINGTLYYGGLASSICPGSGDSCGLEHGIVTMGTVYADIRGEVLHGVNRGSYSTPSADPLQIYQYVPYFDIIETEASQEQEEAPAQVYQEMLIAWGQECADLTCAMTKINPETTDLMIKIGYNFAQYYSITIPYLGNSLQQVTIDADTPMTVTMQNLGVYANGVKLTIGKNVTLQGSVIYAGGSADNGRNIKENAELVIDGTVGTVYAGGAAGCRDCVANVGDSKVTITGYVVNSVYGGGYAAEKGAEANNGSTTLILTNTSKIRQNLYLGGYAVNYCDPAKRGTPEECDNAGNVSVGIVNAAIYGEVIGDIVENGASAEGAPSTIDELVYIEAPEEGMMDRTDPQIIRVGDYEEHKTIQHAFQTIRYPGGDVIIQLTGKLNASDDIQIPTNKSIRSIRFESDRENAVRTIDLRTKMFCANGIPTTIGKDITIVNGPVLAGGKSSSGTVVIPEAALTIDGTIHNNVYGGGAASCISTLYENCTSDVGDSHLIINGTVQGNVFLGGYTTGSGSKASITGVTRITMSNSALLRGNLYFSGNPQSEKNQDFVSYCETNKQKIGICSPDYLNTAGTVNRAEAALYGMINGSVIHSDMTGPAYTVYNVNDYAYVETDPEIMNLEDPQMVRVGPAETYTTLPIALENIRYSDDGTDVVLVTVGNIYLTDNVEIPYEKNIKSFMIETDRPGVNRTVDLGNKNFYANGIPLTIGENIYMTNTNVYAGKNLQIETEEDLALYKVKSVSADSAQITLLGTAANIYAGGRAVGNGIESLVGFCELDIRGTVQRSVYGGGTAINSAHTSVGQTVIRLGPDAKVNANIYCGGYAEITKEKGYNEPDSLSEVKAVTIIDTGNFDREHIFDNGLNGFGGVSTVGSVSFQ